MSKKRKVNAPVRERKKQEAEAKRKVARKPKRGSGAGTSVPVEVQHSTYVKVWMIVDLVFCAFHLIGLMTYAVAHSKLDVDGNLIIYVILYAVIGLCGIPAAVMILLGRPVGITLAWITAGATGLALLCSLIGLGFIAEVLGGVLPANVGGLIVGGAVIWLVIRADLLLFYCVAVIRARDAMTPTPILPEGVAAPPPPGTNAIQFAKVVGLVAILGLVTLCIIAIVMGSRPSGPLQPWADYQDRVLVTPTPTETIREYKYNEREVPHWIAGVKNKEITQADFERITALASRWLAAEDATQVILAAGAAHPKWVSSLKPHAEKLIGSTNDADPDSRDIKVRLRAMINQAEPPPPAPAPVTEPE